ncbi:MAG: hypothetical protein WD097_01395 [Balneolales bacterium]
MRTKLLFTIIILAGLIFLANWLTGRYIASIIDQQLQQVSTSGDELDYRYTSMEVNPVMASITINDFSFQELHTIYGSRTIKASLSYADIGRLIRNSSENPLANIYTLRITATDLQIWNLNRNGAPTNDNKLAIGNANIIYNGRLDELTRIPLDTHPPDYNHRINLNLTDISSEDKIQILFKKLPVLSDYSIPDDFEQIHLHIQYRAGQKTVDINNFRVSSPRITFQIAGDIKFGDTGWPEHPEYYQLNYQLQATTHDMARLSLPGILGDFSMDTLSANGRLQFDYETASRHPFALPGKTSLYLENIRWYPSTQLAEQYDLFLGMFGFSGQQLPVRSIQATWHFAKDTIRIDNALLSTIPFDAQIHAVVSTPQNRRADIQNGTVTFVRTSAAFNDMVDGIEGLFHITLPRKEGRLSIEFSGNPASPEFDLNLP